MTDKLRYSFTIFTPAGGAAELAGHITQRQRDLIEAILCGQLTEYIDEVRAGRNAFPRRSTGDGGMTLRDYFASDAPISLTQAIAVEYQADIPHMTDASRAKVFETLARMRYEYADGSPCADVAYVGEMTFLESLARIVACRGVVARIDFGEAIGPAKARDRREAARLAQERVATLLRLDPRDNPPGRARDPRASRR